MKRIKFNLGNSCNFSCSYCMQSNARKRNKDTFETEVNRSIEISKNFYKLNLDKNEKVTLGFLGGEPTIYPLIDIITNLKDCISLQNVQITTNFSASKKYFVDLLYLLYVNGIKCSITASYHEEFFKFDNFLEKLLWISECPSVDLLESQITVTKENYSESLEKAFKLKLKGIKVKLDEAREHEHFIGLSKEQISLMKFISYTKDLETNIDSTNFKNVPCRIPYNSINIDSYGNVTTGFKQCPNEGFLGNIITSPKIELPKGDIYLCNSKVCTLGSRFRTL